MEHFGESGGFFVAVVLPVVLIGAAALAIPFMVTPKGTRSQRRLVLSVLLSALFLFGLSGALFAVLYQAEGKPLWQVLSEHPQQVVAFLARRAGLAILVWGPLMLLAWLSLARRIERIKAEEGMRLPAQDDVP
ncbi:hypothetical protein [Celeribacter baekdonensis]|jgi:hypothetical protein|uniref:hypothetical protein n=1 Tax=Celeribacter baekdonensis TaxID=875171 RepID=UPI0030D9A73E|tara:strand:- start:178940 stop:179338 length:399 start_codon:yes stop_codon:yes gene_type:complete